MLRLQASWRFTSCGVWTDFISKNWTHESSWTCIKKVWEFETWSGNVRKSRSSIFCFSWTSSCSFVERVREKMWMVAVAFLIQEIIPWMKDQKPTWPGRWWWERWWGREGGLLFLMLAAGSLSSTRSQLFPWTEKIFKKFSFSLRTYTRRFLSPIKTFLSFSV